MVASQSFLGFFINFFIQEGGLNSLPGAIVGGLLLGLAESLAGGYLPVAFKNTLAFLVIIVILLIRPEGLLGTVFKERV